MQILGDRRIVSASDLNDRLACRHLLFLNLQRALGELDDEPVASETGELLARKGDEHESAYLESLKDRGLEVVELTGPDDRGIEAFAVAMEGRHAEALARTRALDSANKVIHGAIVTAARHRQLGQLLTRTVDVSLVFLAFRTFSPEQTRQSHEFHQLIRAAVAAREPTRAGALMAEHILQGRDVLLAAIDED